MENNNSKHRWYVLAMLTLVYMFNLIDRQIIVVLQDDIRLDLELNYTQLGVLMGPGFAVLYILLGIPIARFADLGNRKNIVSLSLTIWSGMTILSGNAKNFLHLLLSRIGVGIGEAGGTPPSYAIISDYFPPEKRATALSIFSSGTYLGVLFGYIFGGIIGNIYGWRIVFYVFGVLGLFIAGIFYSTVKEPFKGQLDSYSSTKLNFSFVEVFKFLFKKKTFLFLSLAIGFHAFVVYSMGSFLQSFYQTVHGLEKVEVGIILGLAFGIGGGIGTLLGGYIADSLRKKDKRWYLWVPLLGGISYIIPFFIVLLTANTNLAFIITFIATVLGAVSYGPVIAVTHSLVDAKMRALASAILLFVINGIGLGLGPLCTGIISDALSPQYGHLSLRWALCLNIIPLMISITFFYFSSRNYLKDIVAEG